MTTLEMDALAAHTVNRLARYMRGRLAPEARTAYFAIVRDALRQVGESVASATRKDADPEAFEPPARNASTDSPTSGWRDPVFDWPEDVTRDCVERLAGLLKLAGVGSMASDTRKDSEREAGGSADQAPASIDSAPNHATGAQTWVAPTGSPFPSREEQPSAEWREVKSSELGI